jgi:elongation factor G
MSAGESVTLERVRNIGIMAHIDAGKTTTTERILYYTGQIHKMGEVHEGDTEMDWMDQERERGITITSAATTCSWKGCRINIIDTPGHVDFTAEVERSLRVLDGGVVIFSGVEMVESQSEAVWRQADRYRIPRLAFVNKLDRVESSYTQTLAMIEERLGVRVVPLQLAYRDSDRHLVGMIDLVRRQLVIWERESEGKRYDFYPIPEAFEETVEHYREMAVERVAEFDDRVMRAYLNGEEIDEQAFHEGLRQGCISNSLVPVLGGAAFQNIGVQPLLDAIVCYLPSPLDVPPVRGVEGNEVRRAANDAPFAALAFKVVTDRYAGRLVFIRIYSGQVEAGGYVYNSAMKKGLRITKVFRMHANQRTSLDVARAGEIVAVVGSQDISTGDTLCDRSAPILLEKIDFPDPVVFVSVEPRTEAERSTLIEGLTKLAQEDPTFRVQVDGVTNQTIIAGMGELHLEVLVRRLQEEQGIVARVGKPRVAYYETLREPMKIEEKFVKQSGGRAQYAHVIIQFEPLPRGDGFRFLDVVTGDIIPKEYRASVEMGLRETLTNGPLAGYPLTDFGATLLGGSYHPLESSELAFRAAATAALHRAYEEGTFELLEPIMEGEVITPVEYVGDVIEDLARRRGEVRELQARETVQIIFVAVPLAEMFGYASCLRSLSQGRAIYTLRVTRYAVVPEGLKEKIIKGRGY